MHIGLRLGDIKGATGSVYIELNNTKLFAAVNGPIEPEMQHESMSGIIECIVDDAWKQDSLLESLSHKLQNIFRGTIHIQTYRKTLIRIGFTILERGDSLADAAILAGSLALIDAGIEMNDFIVSCTVALTDGQLTPFGIGDCSIRAAILPSTGEIVETEIIGKISPNMIQPAINVALTGTKEIAESVRAYLDHYVK